MKNVSTDLANSMVQLRDKVLLKRIAVVLKQLREKAGLVQTDVYADTNIHVGRIETAKANLSISTLSELCKFYKISLADFFKKVEGLDPRKISAM